MMLLLLLVELGSHWFTSVASCRVPDEMSSTNQTDQSGKCASWTDTWEG